MKVEKCKGNGQAQCARCKEKGKWNVSWCCFFYKIEGYKGVYCHECMEKILLESEVEE